MIQTLTSLWVGSVLPESDGQALRLVDLEVCVITFHLGRRRKEIDKCVVIQKYIALRKWYSVSVLCFSLTTYCSSINKCLQQNNSMFLRFWVGHCSTEVLNHIVFP